MKHTMKYVSPAVTSVVSAAKMVQSGLLKGNNGFDGTQPTASAYRSDE